MYQILPISHQYMTYILSKSSPYFGHLNLYCQAQPSPSSAGLSSYIFAKLPTPTPTPTTGTGQFGLDRPNLSNLPNLT